MKRTYDRADCVRHFNEVYDLTFENMRRFAAQHCADPDRIPDLLQEIYLEYYRVIQRKGVEYVQDPPALLYKIARRKAMGYYSLRQRLSRPVPLPAEAGGDEPADPLDVEEAALTAAEADRIWEIIASHPSDVRKIMYLYFREDLSLPEISRATGLSLSNVKNKLYRTLDRIKEEINDEP